MHIKSLETTQDLSADELATTTGAGWGVSFAGYGVAVDRDGTVNFGKITGSAAPPKFSIFTYAG